MSTAEHASVSLRARHPSMSPTEISELLGLEPARSWRSGDPRTTPLGHLQGGTRAESYWTREVGARGSVEETLDEALALLSSHRAALEKLREAGCTVELFVGWFPAGSGGFTLQDDVLRRLTDLGLDLSLSVYPK